jgi:hypothetical protein
MNPSIIHLSKEDAESFFGRPYWDPMWVIEHWNKQFTDDNSEKLYPELKFLIVVTRAYLRYSSEDVRYLIMGLCTRYINDIYTKNPLPLPLENLKFLGTFILRYRNLKDYRKMKKLFIQPEHLEKLRYGLFQNGVLDQYQASFFE